MRLSVHEFIPSIRPDTTYDAEPAEHAEHISRSASSASSALNVVALPIQPNFPALRRGPTPAAN
jgi:hypothetical protein